MHDINEPGVLTIDRRGGIVATNDAARRVFRRQSGRWELTAAGPGIAVLRKAVADESKKPKVLLSGEIRKDGWLIEIVNFISTSHLTGRLTTVCARVQRDLFFENGSLRMAASSARTDLLGEFAVHEGVITRDQLEDALNRQTEGKRLGQVLVDRGVITTPDLYQLIHRFVEKVFYDTIGLRQGTFHFVTDVDLSSLPAYMCLDTQALLLEGLRCIDELQRYRQRMPRKLEPAASDPANLRTCSVAERVFLEWVDGRRTLAEIGETLRMGDLDTVRIVNKLIERGMLDVPTEEEARGQVLGTVVDIFNQVLDQICTAVQDHIPRAELKRLGDGFIQTGGHNNEDLARLQLTDDGAFSLENVRTLSKGTQGDDGVKHIVMVLTEYISFALFTATSFLSINDQQKLSSKVYGTLSVFSTF
jgi:hypothetical protein